MEAKLIQRVRDAEKRKLYQNNPEYREKRKQQWREYNKRTREHRNAYAKVKVQCDCGSTYCQAGKSQHFKTRKHREFLNKGKACDEEKRVKLDCECGGVYDAPHKSRHLKTKRHINYIDNIKVEKAQRKIVKTICPCGGKYDNKHKKQHLNSARHQKYEANK